MKDELSTAISQTGTEVRKFFFLREKICFDQLLLRIAFRHTVWISILLFFYYCSILLLFSHLEQLNSTTERLDQEDNSIRTLLDHINTTLSIKVLNSRTSNLLVHNRPRSIYQYSNIAPRHSGQTCIFAVVFFVSKSLLWIEKQRKVEKKCNSGPKA